METREIRPGMTYNPDTGSYTVRDAAGAYVGSTTQSDVAEQWRLTGVGSGYAPGTAPAARVTCTAHAASFPAGWEAGHAAGPCGEQSTHGACSFTSPYGGADYGTAHVAVFAGRYCAEHGARH